jgi:hypothetical protein
LIVNCAFFALVRRSWQLPFMTLVNEMPPWMHRHFAVYVARSSHNFCAKQIRKKLIVETNADALLAEAFAMVRREIGTFPSEENPANSPFPDDEDESTERDMRDIAMRNYDSLSEIETYMWGLGIAGVFHQWERGTRDVIRLLPRRSDFSSHLTCRLVGPKPDEDRVAQQSVAGPGQIGDFGDELRLDPMNARQYER